MCHLPSRCFLHIVAATALATLAVVAVPACSTSSSAPRRDSAPTRASLPASSAIAVPGGIATHATAHTASHEAADGGAAAFCGQARALGLEQSINLHDGSAGVDPSVLTKLDNLAALAPTEIASDFRLFVSIEHAILGRGAANPRVLDKVDDPTTAQRLQHVATYLGQHCGTKR